MDRSKLARKFDKQAAMYGRQRERKALGNWRKQLLQDAAGNVLELAVGAGANFAYYKPDVYVTAVDISPKMLDNAVVAADVAGIQVDFQLSDMEGLEYPENSFDTIVSTLSFCSYDDPVHLLNQLSFWCKPQGKILLLEHGISSNPLIGLVQKIIDPVHYKLIGCHQKRDMLGLINESNLQIKTSESHWKGMFHLVWATPESSKSRR